MQRGIFLISITVLLLSFTTTHAADVFRAETKKVTTTCSNGGLFEGRAVDIFIRFDNQTQLTWSFDKDFERSDQMKMVQYFESEDRADFVAIRSDLIIPEAGEVDGGFSAMYGKVTLDADLNPVKVNGKLTRMFITSDGEECIQFIRLKTVELLASVEPPPEPTPEPMPTPTAPTPSPPAPTPPAPTPPLIYY
jgi:hypothetical protein